MQNLYFKPTRALLMHSIFIIAFLIPSLSGAWYGGRNHGHYGHNGYGHYGYRKYGGHNYYPHKYYQYGQYSYYPSRSYQKYPKSHTLAVPDNIKVYSDNNETLHSNSFHSRINSRAWQTLTQGEYRTALNIFAQEAQSYPNSGIPKVGYALATASSGNLERGVWAMRRALRIDPTSLHYLQLNEKGRVLIEYLIHQYSSQENQTNFNQAFMVSALHYLIHDYVAAKKSIASAQQYGEKSPSFTNLQKLVDHQLTD